jgi:hypothetical protein
MALLHSLLLLFHLLGMAVLVGGFSSQLNKQTPHSTRRITPGQWHGALLSLVTGLVLVGLAEVSPGDSEPINHVKIAIKLMLALVIAVLAFRGRQRTVWPQGWLTLGLLAVLNTTIAVLVP